MTNLKYSRQRASIMEYLTDNPEHPTADMVYANMRIRFPNISLGTVYRNLSLLTELKQIQRLNVPGHPDRYDYQTDPHYHFICEKCGRVFDLPGVDLGDIDNIAGRNFDGIITGHSCGFFGICAECK